MKFIDIRKAITEILNKKIGFEIRYEDINKIKRPCFFLDIIDYRKEFDSKYRELKRLDFDILYFPKQKEGNNTEIIEALEEVDDAWEIAGDKVLRVLDRYMDITDVTMRIVDDVGHYMFSIELFDTYGKPIDYELMGELHLSFKEEGR